MAKAAAGGAVSIFGGKMFSYLIGLGGSLIVARLLGPNELGLLAVAMVLPGILGAAGDLGISAAIIKFTSESAAKGEGTERNPIYCGLYFDILLGCVLSLLGFFGADFFASLLGKPDTAFLLRIASFAVVAGFIQGVFSAAFVGLEDMKSNAYMTIGAFAAQYAASVLLIILGLGSAGAVFGYVVGPLFASALALLVLFKKFRPKRTFRPLGKMLRYGLPLSTQSAVINLQGQFLNGMTAASSTAFSLGNYYVALKFHALIDLLESPLQTVMFPAFSKLSASVNSKDIATLFDYSVKYQTLIVVPSAFGIVALSKPLVTLLFGYSFDVAWLYLSLIAIGWLYMGSGGNYLFLVLMGQGESLQLMKFKFVYAASSLGSGILLIPSYGVIGFILTTLIAFWPQYVLTLVFAKSKYGIEVPLRKVQRIYLASALAVAPVFLLTLTPLSYLWQIAIGVPLAMAGYIIAIAKLDVLKEADLFILEGSLGSLRFVGGVFSLALLLVRKLK